MTKMNSRSERWNRRTLLGAGASALSLGLAGCMAGNESGSQSTDGTNGGSVDGGSGEEQLDFAAARAATKVQFNRWNLSNFAHTYRKYFSTPVATAYSDGTISSAFLDDISIDGKEMTLTFPTGWTYWNGREVKARDYYISAEIDRLQDPEASSYASHELVDERTLRRTFKNSVQPSLMKASLVGTAVNTPRWIFEEYLTRYQDASNAEERDAITQELVKMTISTKQFVEEGLGNGLYKITQYNSAETIAEKYEDHPYADRTDVMRTRIVPLTDNTDSLATSDKLDMTPKGYIKEPARYPENIKNQFELNWFRTQKFVFNWKNEHLANRNVRRAIISAVDLNSITASAVQAAYTAEPTQVQTGLRSSIHEEFLGQEFVDKLIEYPVSSDTETAAEYMRQAGYSKQGGTWTSSEGEPVSLDILTNSDIGQSQPTKVFNDQLNQFGIETSLNAVGENYYTKFQEWDFDLGWMWHVSKALWHPTAYYSNQFTGVLVGNPSNGGETGPTGIPFETTIPSQVGTETVSGSGQTIRPAQLMDDLPASTSKEQVRDRTKTLVHWFNYDLPGIVYMQENSGYWGDEANFDFPDGSDERQMNTDNPGKHAWMQGWVGNR